jgi:hypothetical protein
MTSFFKVKSRQRIAKENLNHDLFFLKVKSHNAGNKSWILFLERQIASWFGKGVFGKSNHTKWEIIT